ncbi:DNA-binding transcriptional activator of the SARP family [Micromonospora echinaurantiaca]|uniref:DNA-binding transcriptional activator of the SARP family n=1 Tax=Micromonospora echinaurantiaca TaxID=47857 RepID=A0A1C5IFU5_9ACTN|nr:AfsR/SARP family transcriptional regulator [Micromonospora echinaurantiaca]SCG57302.1 DNA-binding transcriptional activator of the SARP family [Micromonospora echinaurantiaca]
MRFLVLGHFVANMDGESQKIGGKKVRALLASLLLRPNQVASTADLIRRVWGDASPAAPRRVLQTYIVRLRQALTSSEAIITRPDGYEIRVEDDELDLLQFQQLIGKARDAGRLEQERELLHDALRLWRGPVCADIQSDILHGYDVPPITEQRLLALERRIEIDIRLGCIADLAPELFRITKDFPFRERLWVELMAVLYRQGRQADALDAYQSVSRQLNNEMGIEPGRELQETYLQILRGCGSSELLFPPEIAEIRRFSVSSAATQTTSAPNTQAIVRQGPTRSFRNKPHELPTRSAKLYGRAANLKAMDDTLRHFRRENRVVPGTIVVDGAAGVGKTALAVNWCTAATDDFPGGQLYLDLQGFGTHPPVGTVDALAILLCGLGIAPSDLPVDIASRSNLFRSLTAGQRILVLLDNARDSDQVRPLLPGRSCTAVVTSRSQMRGLVAHDGAERISLSGLGADASFNLLSAMVGDVRAEAERNDVLRIGSLCDYLPLALRIVGERAARLPGLRMAQLVNDLSRGAGWSDIFDAGGGMLVDLQTAFSWSYESLDPATARVFRVLGGICQTREFGLTVAAAVCGLPIADIRLHLDRLVALHLVDQSDHDRYRFQHLLHRYASEQARRLEHEPSTVLATPRLPLRERARGAAITRMGSAATRRIQ